MTRRVLHLDMDAFFASVEQADNPEMRGKPVIVGGRERGVVCAASYEARKFGLRSAMPIFQAKRLCPRGIFLPVRMGRYKEVSRRVMEILSGLSPLVEPVSIDEAFVDITGTEAIHGPPAALGLKTKAAVLAATSLTCSVGIAPNKFLAKIASDFKKPDGLTIIEEADVRGFLEKLPVRKIPGVGGRTAEELRKLGVAHTTDILKLPVQFWVKKFGKWGARLHEKAQGIDHSPVEPGADPKSISAEETFARDIDSMPDLEKMLLSQAEEVGRDLRKHGFQGRTVTLKLKYADFKIVTRSRTLPEPMDSTDLIFSTARQLLADLKPARKIRLIGVGVSNFTPGFHQLRIEIPKGAAAGRGGQIGDPPSPPGQSGQISPNAPCPARRAQIDRALDAIHDRFGKNSIKRGRLIEPE